MLLMALDRWDSFGFKQFFRTRLWYEYKLVEFCVSALAFYGSIYMSCQNSPCVSLQFWRTLTFRFIDAASVSSGLCFIQVLLEVWGATGILTYNAEAIIVFVK